MQAVLIDGVASVPAYPGLTPSPGHEFVEVRVAFPWPTDPGHDYRGDGTREWRAVGSDGETLPFVPASAAELGGIITPLMPDYVDRGTLDWLVIEAPALGPLTLEFRRHGEGPPLFTYDLRAAEAPEPS